MIIGKNIDLRPVQLNDAQFILSLRLDPLLNKYINSVVNNIKTQEEWLKSCITDKAQWYFIIQNKSQEPVGTIRIYDIKENSFSWGSWIIIPKARYYASFESAVLLYKYAFFDLGFVQSHFDVRRDNKNVINFHLKFGATIVSENDLDIFFIFTKTAFIDMLPKYQQIVDMIST